MYNATITKIIQMNNKLREFTIKLDEGDPSFLAGQFSVIGLQTPEGTTVKRAYSIVSAPQDGDRHFYIVLKYTKDKYDSEARPRALTPLLFDAKEGDRIFLSPRAVGHFTLNLAKEAKQLLFIATGTGLAPFRGMLRSYPEILKTHKIALLHGVRHSNDLGYRDEFTTLAQANSKNFFYIPIVSQEDSWMGQKGRTGNVLSSNTIETFFGKSFSAETHAFFCGNPRMIEEGFKILEEKGIPSPNLHKEVQ
ncbi:MAG: ferredoxin--NADP reductase [Alphaproteobacteria bacterium]|nr:ferredoxin--NADP reductase [Alphaproteobacteria bacterium]